MPPPRKDLGSSVVDAVIYNLRKKMGNQANALQTVRGFGYRLTPG